MLGTFSLLNITTYQTLYLRNGGTVRCTLLNWSTDLQVWLIDRSEQHK